MKRLRPMALMRVFILVVTAFWCIRPALADEVRLKNGDRLTGSILSLAEDRLRFETSYAGELSLPWSEVVSLKTDRPVMVTLTRGDRLIGWFEPSRSGGLLLLSAFGKLLLRSAEVSALRPLSEEEVLIAGAFVKPPRWESQVEAGVQVRSGNVDSQDLNIGLQTMRKTQGSEISAKVTAAYGETERERTVGQVLGEVRLDLFHTERFFSFYLLDLEHDALQDLNLRAQEDVGVGYKFIRTPRSLLQGEVGVGLTEEFFEGEKSDLEPVGRLGAKWTEKVGEQSELGVILVLFPDLSDLGEYRFRGESSFTTPITDRFLLRLSLLNRFDSDPQPGVKKNDLTFRSSVVWTF